MVLAVMSVVNLEQRLEAPGVYLVHMTCYRHTCRMLAVTVGNRLHAQPPASCVQTTSLPWRTSKPYTMQLHA